MADNTREAQFQKTVLTFYKKNKRTFPWRSDPSPYFVVVSEVMLQQTQADRVVPKFVAFIKKFPSFNKLSQARLPEVLMMWQGLGYNRRAKSLHQLAKLVVKKYNGKLPSDTLKLITLPGIGPYTAAAIQAFAFNLPSTVIETNIRTAFIFHFFKDTKNKVTDAELIPFIQRTVYRKNPQQWYSALMDYGSYLKKNYGNLSQKSKTYKKQSRFKGSNRQARGAVIRELSKNQRATTSRISKESKIDDALISSALEQLHRENLVIKDGRSWRLAG